MAARSLSPTRRELLAATAAAGAISLLPARCARRRAATPSAPSPSTSRKTRSPSFVGALRRRAGPTGRRSMTSRRAYSSQTQAARRILGHRLRLAQGRSQAECLAAVHDRDRRARHPLHPRSLKTSERASCSSSPMAGRAPCLSCSRSSVRSRSRPRMAARRGCVRRRHPVDAGLRLLRQADRRRLGTRPHRAGMGGADEAPRLHKLRRPGRRLGLTRFQRDGAPGAGGPARHPHQSAGDGTARGRRRARGRRARPGGTLRPGTRGVRRAEHVPQDRGRCLQRDDDSAAANDRLRHDRLAGRPRGMDARASRFLALELRGSDPEQSPTRRGAGRHHAVLADEHRSLGRSALLGERPGERDQRHRAEDRRDFAARGHHRVSGGRLSGPGDLGPACLSQSQLLPRGR